MLSTEDPKPKRKSASKAIIESDDEDDEVFAVPNKRKDSQLSKAAQEDEDFQLAIELSKAATSPKSATKRKARSSFVFDSAMAENSGPGEDEEEDVFESDEVEDEIEEAELESDEAFSESEEEELVIPAKKGKKAASAGKAAPKKAAATAKKPVASKPAAKSAPASKAVVKSTTATPVAVKFTPKAASAVPKKPSFPTPTGGVNIAQDGPRRRVGLSRTSAPKGPLSPVKIRKLP